MNSRERVAAALEHRKTDRIPVDFWASKGLKRNIETALSKTFEDFLDENDVDLRYIDGPEYIGPALSPDEDIWGVKRQGVEVKMQNGIEVYDELKKSPLAEAQTAEEILEFPGWPSADDFDYSCVKGQCREIAAKERFAVFMGDRLNRISQLKPAMYIRGMENIMIDLAVNPGIAKALFMKIREFYLEYLRRILDAAEGGIDIVLTGDDFGSQTGPLISPDMWKKFIQPGFTDYLSLIREHGLRSMHHSCGAIREIIPGIIESGLDILQSLQPEAPGMNLSELAGEFGDRICFQGGISIQKTLPFGTPDEIREEVKRAASVFRERGGYIFCTAHNIQADAPMENVLTLLEAYREFGRT